MRHFSTGARRSARQGFVAASIQSLHPLRKVFLAACIVAFVAASSSHAALTFDLRAVSGSQVTIYNPKSVGVNQSSVGGWIDFELYAFVNGANDNAKDESIHSFAGNMLSTHFGHGAVGGSMLNKGEMDARIRRGILSPMDHNGHSDGRLQNLDRDPDLEIGGTGWEQTQWGNWEPSTHGEIVGRGNPFRVRNYEGEGAIAEFLLYRFTLPIESYLAEGLADVTRIHFTESIFPNAYIWREDGMSKSPSNDGVVDLGQSVFIHTAETPSDIAAIPEPATYILGTVAVFGLILAQRRGRVMRRTSIVLVLLASLVAMASSPANAALTFDLRAVSGSQVTIHNPKSVGVNKNSVGGWIDFELWALVSGTNAIATDDGMQNFIGNMLSTHSGRGAAAGSMINTGEIAPRIRRGVLAPYDGPAYQDGTVQSLDGDPELEIGGTDYRIGRTRDMIAARTGTGPIYSGADGQQPFPLYRFTLPIESVPAESLSDVTHVQFEAVHFPLAYIWWEDSVLCNPPGFGVPSPSTMTVNEPVLIHTAQTPEELAAIPEPGTWALGFSGMLGAGWFAKRRRRH